MDERVLHQMGNGPGTRWRYVVQIRDIRRAVHFSRIDCVRREVEMLFAKAQLDKISPVETAELCVALMDSIAAFTFEIQDPLSPAFWSEDTWHRLILSARGAHEDPIELVRDTVLEICFGGRDREISLSTSASRLVKEAKNIIHKEYASELTLVDIAKRLYISPNHLSRVFKSQTGATVTQFITSVRLEHAQHLLRLKSDMKTYEIAQETGYPDPVYFNKIFKRVVGMTPNQYRSLG